MYLSLAVYGAARLEMPFRRFSNAECEKAAKFARLNLPIYTAQHEGTHRRECTAGCTAEKDATVRNHLVHFDFLFSHHLVMPLHTVFCF
jgi:hypothetical protein